MILRGARPMGQMQPGEIPAWWYEALVQPEITS
jgi:hypothetical protein